MFFSKEMNVYLLPHLLFALPIHIIALFFSAVFQLFQLLLLWLLPFVGTGLLLSSCTWSTTRTPLYQVRPRVQVQGNWSPPKPGQSKSNPTPWSTLLVLFSLSLPLLSVPPLAFPPRPPPTFVHVRASARPSFLLSLFRVSFSLSSPLAAPCSRCALPEKYPLDLRARLAFGPLFLFIPYCSFLFICSVVSLSLFSFTLATPLPILFLSPGPRLSFPPTI